jgi:hypothetical protein
VTAPSAAAFFFRRFRLCFGLPEGSEDAREELFTAGTGEAGMGSSAARAAEQEVASRLASRNSLM